MKKWFEEFLNKIRPAKTTKAEAITLSETVNNIARDNKGRWVSDDLGKPVLKTDDPARIERFTKRQEDYYLSVSKKITPTTCCGGGICECSAKPKPTVNKKVEEVKAEAKRQQEKYGIAKPVAKKKPTGGGTKKEQAIE
jgi:hypothetical protein